MSLLPINRLTSQLDRLEQQIAPPPERYGARVVVITCTDDPEPPEGSLDQWLSEHPPCCARGGFRIVEWRDGSWREEQPLCWSCRGMA